MNYLSVCSGIEAATVGWHSLGWQPVAFSEIEPFPCAALAHHYPDVPNWGDMTKFKEWPDANVDVLVGGTPCQSFSVAGLRKGLDDPRGNLMLTYLAIAAKYRPKWVVWENVPGVLSSNGGNDFASLLQGLAELGYGFAYRILDAQHFGVPQRRRRVFVVGCFGDWRSAAAVLFERHSLQGHPAPRREAGKGFAGTIAKCSFSGGAGGRPEGAAAGHFQAVVAPTISARTKGGGGLGTDFDCDGGLIVGALDTECGAGKLTHQSVVNGHVLPVMGTLTTRTFTALGARDVEEGALVPMIAHSLRGKGFDASEDGTGRGTPLVPVAFAHQAGGTQTTLGYDPDSGTAPTLNKSQTAAVAYGLPGNWINRKPENGGNAVEPMHDLSPNLTSTDRHAVSTSMQVRRLTPVECERLQGFPDSYTDIKPNGKPTADGPRYKALGNSMAVPVMAWIGKRIQQVEDISA